MSFCKTEKMKRLHYFSGLFMSLFVGTHLFNHLLGLWGPELHIQVMELLRMGYRFPPVEILLLSAVLVQIFSGFKLVQERGFRQGTLFGKLHVYSGLFLALFLFMHTTATVGGRFAFGIDTNFYYAAMVVNLFPFAYLYIPYYLLGVLAFFVHVACIHRIKMQTVRGVPAAAWHVWGIMGLGLVIGIMILLGLTDFGAGIEIPAAYRKILGQ